MLAAARHLLENNALISGSAVAFEPGYFPAKGTFFSPYAYRSGDSIVCKQLGSENYEYHFMDWYQIPKLLNGPYWSAPYFDTDGGEMIMSTYSHPLLTAEGRLYGIFTADISLERLTQMVTALRIYPHSYNLMIGRSGTYLVHPYPERILDETFFSATFGMEDPAIEQVGHAMIRGEQGMATVQNDDSLSTSYIFYAPVKRNGWSVAVVCTHQDVFAGVDHIRTLVLIIAAMGLLSLLVFCIRIIRRQTAPLTVLADSTVNIAEGDLTSSLPPLKQRNDEIGKLYASFGFMLRSLAYYMRELKVTTANKERIESELRIAGEIQKGMIPKIFPPFPDRSDIDLYATLMPAREVGGDLYDFFVKDDKLYFNIGEVSGKGVTASLLMEVTRSLFRNMTSHLQTPAGILSSLNDSLSESNESMMFVTLFLGILDLRSGRLRYCNAGHNAPVLIGPRRDPVFLDVLPNLPLGLFHGFAYREQEIVLHPESELVLYTDGVTEAENTARGLFSDKRLVDRLRLRPQKGPAKTVGYVLEQVRSYASGTEQNDDITLLCLHYTPNR